MTQLSEPRVDAPSTSQAPALWQPPPPTAPSRGRRLLATLALVTLIVGVPAVLAAVIGSPLPGSLPELAQARSALSSPLASSLVVDALALVAWGAWAHFVVCVLVELVAAVRLRRSGQAGPARRVPGGGWSQDLARRLVEAAFATAVATSVGIATVSGTILTPARPALAASQPSTHAAAPAAEHVALVHDPASAPATAPATAPVAKHRAPVPHAEYVVQAPRGGYYDSLWDIAEKFLGDGQRWREIYELNEGREQPDGRALTRPDLIRPGWRLQLPPDASGLTAEALPGDVQSESTVQEDASEPPPASGPSAAVQADSRPERPSPSVPCPAQLPALASDGSGQSHPEPSAPAHPSPSSATNEEAPTAEVEDNQDDGLWLRNQSLGGLLAAAALAAVATLRHRQRRRRLGGESIVLPGPAVAREERHLRVLAEPADLTFVDEALRALSYSLRDRDLSLPDVRLVSLREGRIDLTLAEPCPDAPTPFLTEGDGTAWHACSGARPLVSPDHASLVPPLLPLLLTVGRDAEGPVLVDLEALGSLAIEGPLDDVSDVLAHVVAEAALAPWAADVEIVLVGFVADVAEDLVSLAPERVTAVDELGPPLLRVLAMRADRVTKAGDRLAARIHAGSQNEVRPPVLVVCAVPPSPASAEQLRCLLPAAGRAAVTVVAPGPWVGARTTWCLGEPLPAPGNGGAPVPCKLDRDRLRSLAELLQLGRQTPAAQAPQLAVAASETLVSVPPMEQSPQADTLPDVRPLRPTSGIPVDNEDGTGQTVEEPRDELDRAVEAYFTNAAPATVSILGPVTVDATGNIDPDRRSRLTEIVAYFATHRRGVPVADFDAALWPERQVTLKTRNQAITRTRAWLGGDDEGASWLRPMTDGTLRLSRQVLVDWELFKALQQRATERRRSTAARRRDLETAMRLVRGRPLSPLPAGRYGWLAETCLEQEIPSAIIDVAHALARLLLEAGDADGAVEVARLALEVDRYDERPWRDLLEAHHRRGQDRQVALLVAQLRELLEVELDDDLQPETAELIERLLRRRRRA